ncbi:uncharacterized protein LOC123271684 [Cotesia glomerata]|uniref:uncharacterized protein LOC123271684 n=1 Tax=Cotesia glomerata TaxID=32391 RepID=UPI001D021E33|nr:uncharacterized protein LOC123271684 [Cotesia glomerata]
MYNALPPRLYGLRKTHKVDCKLRPVVSNIGSPGYEISKFVHKILSPYVLSFEFNMKDSFQFVERIKSVLVDDDYLLISLDVVSLFTNVKQDLITNIIKERWNVIKDFINLDQELLLDLVKFCFHSGYFLFQRNYYIQKEGCGIGSPASPVIAITAVDYVISKALERLDFEIPVVAAYVDDLFLIIPRDKVDTVVNVFNSINKDIQFTIEVEQDGKIPYLDVLVERTRSGELRTSWYQKPYSSGRVLNFKSNHPLSQKLGVAQGLSHATMVAVSTDKVRHLLMNNNYPSSLLSKCEKITSNRISSNLRIDAGLRGWSFCKFPYIKGLSPRIGCLFRQTNCKLFLYNLCKIKDFYSHLKDPVDKWDRSCLVYRIPCTCGKSYKGQTKQKLRKRINQHINDCRPVNINKSNMTALADHHFESGHDFQFDAAQTLDYEFHFLKRNISEMFFIKVFDCVNFRSDTQGLSSSYSDIISVAKRLMQ